MIGTSVMKELINRSRHYIEIHDFSKSVTGVTSIFSLKVKQ